MHIFQNGSLVIHDVAPEDSGSYTCIAGNSCNIKHTEAPLLVVGMGWGREATGPDFFLSFTNRTLVHGGHFSHVCDGVEVCCAMSQSVSLLRAGVLFLIVHSWSVCVC